MDKDRFDPEEKTAEKHWPGGFYIRGEELLHNGIFSGKEYVKVFFFIPQSCIQSADSAVPSFAVPDSAPESQRENHRKQETAAKRPPSVLS
ncbi:hypothetical protein [Silvibacterium dinghuense]|uniref:Uncharacterized protein n=1 Tax=Silvibacterium dinghuense TaxID=1560006 RepID=A0A4Q1S9U2_9BACT|nr:hypothetical protein [Silvibacterium dinghuense]RXS93808.1 hypothetical protein ESZ00_17350 [Silvibacterium dinghuense]